MNLGSRPLAYMFVISICFMFLTLPKAQGQQQAAGLRGSISGRITVDGKPKAGIAVELMKIGQGSSRESIAKTTTSKTGRYVFTGVGAGNYDVSPDTPKLVVPYAGHKGNLGNSVRIETGENVRGINIDLVSQGSISGRIVDNNGRPVAREAVEWLLKREEGTIIPVNIPDPSGRTTNEEGVYHISDIPPGRYIVKVGIPYGLTRRGSSEEGGIDYAETFYPNVNDRFKAVAIEVRPNAETANVDIVVGQPLKTYEISGVVLFDNGALAPDVWLGVKTRSENGKFTTDATGAYRSDANGQFIIKGALPGQYVVYPETDEERNLFGEAKSFEIKESDVAGLKLEVHSASIITGIAVLEGSMGTSMNWSDVQVFAHHVTAEIPHSGRYSSIDSEGRFRVSGVHPGRVSFFVDTDSPEAPQGLKVVRVERNGQQFPEGLEVRSGQDISGIRLVLRAGSGTLKGDLEIVGGELEGVYLFVDYRLTNSDPEQYFHIDVDTRGHFVMNELMPGEYEVIFGRSTVFVSGDGGSRTASRIPTVKQLVTIAPGAQTYVKFVVPLSPVPLPPPQP